MSASEWAEHALDLLYQQLHPPHRGMRRVDLGLERWELATLSCDGAFCVVADDLASSAQVRDFAKSQYLPLSETVRAALGADVAGRVAAYSYSGYGRLFTPPQTNVGLADNRAFRCFRDFCPRTGQRHTHITFGLAGPLFLLGLAEWLRRNSVRRADDLVRGLVLIQPSLALGTAVLSAARRFVTDPLHHRSLPESIEEYMLVPDDFEARLAAALVDIRAARVSVRMLYWPGDRYARFDAALFDRLEIRAAQRREIGHDFSRDSEDPYMQHLAVARHPATLAALRETLAIL